MEFLDPKAVRNTDPLNFTADDVYKGFHCRIPRFGIKLMLWMGTQDGKYVKNEIGNYRVVED
jgi:hypothetical protein